MICDKCGFVMDAFDEDCARCTVGSTPRPVNQTAPDKVDVSMSAFGDFFLYPAGKPTIHNQSSSPSPVLQDTAPPLPEAAIPLPLRVDGWYYAHGGQRIGPISGEEMWRCISTDRVHRETLVWRKGMDDWAMARLTNLEAVFMDHVATPPPLIGEAFNDNFVWLIAFAPVFSAVIAGFIARSWQVPTLSIWWIAPLINSLLCIADKNELKTAGHQTDGLLPWAFFLVPVYLFMRADRLSQNATYAWVWIAMFLLTCSPLILVALR